MFPSLYYGYAPAPLDLDPVLIDEHDLLHRVLEARWRQDRAALLLEGNFGDRAERLAERTEANVATASTSVPAPVASEEISVQFI